MKNCTLNGSKQQLTIKNATFLSGNQPHTIAICSSTSAVPPEIPLGEVDIENVIFSGLSENRGLNVKGLCNYSLDFDSVTIHVRDTIANLNIDNCHFNQTRGIAMYGRDCSRSQITIINSTFTSYTQGVFVFSGNIDGGLIRIKHSNMTENSVQDSKISTAAVLNVYPTSEHNITTVVDIDDCLVANNTDKVGDSEILLIHACLNVSISDSSFVGNSGSPVDAVESDITFSGNVIFEGNSAQEGGALALKSSRIYIMNGATITFNNNTASQFGGAIYVDNPPFELQNKANTHMSCFYQPVDKNFTGIQVMFRNNSAMYGGNNVYGTSINNYCKVENFKLISDKLDLWHKMFDFGHDNRSSLVSSQAMRVCMCEHPVTVQDQCADEKRIFNTYVTAVYPGQPFTISVVLVGAQFGTTIGHIFARLASPNNVNSKFGNKSEIIQSVTNNSYCTDLTYTIWSSRQSEMMSLSALENAHRFGETTEDIRKAIKNYKNSTVVPVALLTTPLYFNIMLKDCPLGFNLVKNSYCNCSAILLSSTNVECMFKDGNGCVCRQKDVWIRIRDCNETNSSRDITISKQCPFDYCNHSRVCINFEEGDSPDKQCAFNRTGTLCGGCVDDTSLAIGSSHCVLDCDKNKGLALLVFFVAAGPLLYVFIAVLSLTISQGLINSLLFYANVVWIYQNALFPSTENLSSDACKTVVQVLKVFTAWLNLDFGIETCFINGLDAFWKSILQYVFPIYIWLIAGMVIGLYRCINVRRMYKRWPRLEFLTDSPENVLVTLILLSYTKLIRNVRDGLTFSRLEIYSDNGTQDNAAQPSYEWVWTLDGNLGYLKDWHIALFIISLLALLITLAYTIYILIMGIRHYLCECNIEELAEQDNGLNQYTPCKRCMNKIFTRFTFSLPLGNAHFAAFNKKHQYWLGLMLLTRIILLLAFTVSSEIAPEISLPILSTTATLLLFYSSWNDIHIGKKLQMLQSFCLGNLILVSGGIQYADLKESNEGKAIIICISTGMALIQFLGIVLATSFAKIRQLIRHPTDGNVPQPAVRQPVGKESDENAPQPAIEQGSDRYRHHLGSSGVHHP